MRIMKFLLHYPLDCFQGQVLRRDLIFETKKLIITSWMPDDNDPEIVLVDVSFII